MKRFNHFSGTVIVPLLARIVLFFTFFFVGANKLFQTAEFDTAAAERLRALGVTVTPASVIHPIVQDESVAEHEQEDGEQGDAAPPSEPDHYLATNLHRITLLLDDAGWPYPVWQARAAGTVEMVGGALLLIGLFSRLWGLMLAGVMVAAFCLVSMGVYGVHTSNPFTFALDVPQFNTVAAQFGLFVLAFGVLLTGPGPVSVDRLLFHARSAAAAGRPRENMARTGSERDGAPSAPPGTRPPFTQPHDDDIRVD